MNAKCAKTVGYWMEENHAQTASSRPIKREGGMMDWVRQETNWSKRAVRFCRWVKRKFRRHPLIVIWESILALIVLTALMLAVFYVIGVVLIGKT